MRRAYRLRQPMQLITIHDDITRVSLRQLVVYRPYIPLGEKGMIFTRALFMPSLYFDFPNRAVHTN